MIKDMIKEILKEELSSTTEPKEGEISGSSLYERFIGKYVIVRSRNEGINAGTVLMADSSGVILKNARRLWYHKPVNGSWYEGVANTGLSSDSKVSAVVKEKAIIEDYSITLVSKAAQQSIVGKVQHNG